MSIAVRCSNIVRFDPQAGKYVHCHREFVVKDELAGRTVKCPGCGQSVTVIEAKPAPAAREASTASKTAVKQESAPAANDRRSGATTARVKEPAARPAPAAPRRVEPPPVVNSSPMTTSPPRIASPPGVASPSGGNSAPATEVEYPEVLDDEDGFRLSAPVELPKREFTGLPPAESAPSLRSSATSTTVPDASRSTTPEVHPAAEETAPCAGCSRPLQVRTILCPSCGYHKGLRRRVDAFEGFDEEKEVTGFERWLRRQLVEGSDPDAVRSMMVMAGILALAFGAILFLVIGHLIWLLAAAVGVVAAGAWMGWWKLDPWTWLLFGLRMAQWRKPAPPFTPRKVLELRDMQLGDAELGGLKNLAEFEVLDLEGTLVTDQGLPALYDHRNLQFLILRDTQTTPQGVERLQQALPNAWIWR